MIFGKPARLGLAVDQVAVDGHIEYAAGAFGQFGLDPECLVNRVRQTDGFGVVVSLYAVFDADVHGRAPIEKHGTNERVEQVSGCDSKGARCRVQGTR